MILIKERTEKLDNVLIALNALLGKVQVGFVVTIAGHESLVKALLDAAGIPYVEAPDWAEDALVIEPAVWVREAELPEAPAAPAETAAGSRTAENSGDQRPMKVCKECGKGFRNRKGDFCSKTCYMKDYFRRNPKAKKVPSEAQKKLAPAENARLHMAPDERIEANIERIVERAKNGNGEGGNLEKTMMGRGTSLRARKVG